MDRDELLERLSQAFVAELDEHVRVLNESLLALEKQADEAGRAALIERLFREAHSIKGSARAASVELVERASSRIEEILSALRDGRRPLDTELIDLLFQATDAIEEAGARLKARQGLEGTALEGLVARLEQVAAGASRGAPAPLPALAAAPAPGALETVRTPTERLDRLLALGGELLAARRVGEELEEQIAGLQLELRRFVRESASVEKLLAPLLQDGQAPRRGPRRGACDEALDSLRRQHASLRRLEARVAALLAEAGAGRRRVAHAIEPMVDEVRALRMVPFFEACRSLERAVRDLAHQEGKQAELEILGADVELDRSIIETLRNPLLHLVRNAVAHGIEPSAEREAAGKSPAGRVEVTATLRGSQVEVAVGDDGRGLDIERIRQRARKRGLPAPADEAGAARLIFRPGFSTLALVTDLAGRGVGLDVVRRAAESLQGSVEVESRRGQGARFVMRMPLTLVSIRALLVEAGGQVFAFPSNHLQRVLAARPGDLRLVEGRQTLPVEGAPIPVASLAGLLGLREPARRGETVSLVIAGTADRPVAFGIDRTLAEREILVKGLGPRIKRLRHFSGATTLPSGELALILQVPDLLASVAGAPAAVAAPYRGEAPAKKRRIVLADDSVTTRTLERGILEGAGYEVRVAADGVQAWRLLQAEGADLLVVDVDMPAMSGLELTEKVRASEQFRELPVILVTALETEDDRLRGLRAGASAYLTKSTFDQRNLLETIEQLLGEPGE
ncbi:MAG: hybrid sensor histidine kinase/response regulator [Myxococcales bacterium]|jgi:two-component system chemotaxis sensor kinase CheA